MAENTKIEWVRHTWNPWMGCTEVSPACDHCYARVMMADRYGRVEWGPGKPRVRTSVANRKLPLRWDRAAKAAGERHTVFCLSLGDIWDKEVDPLWREETLATADATPNLISLFLSKRIGNATPLCYQMNRGLPANAALGATMVNQAEWDRDTEKLRYAGNYLGALFTFASVEPMLGPIQLGDWCPDWVICGGESGPGARDMPVEWAMNLKAQVEARGKAFFMKQMARKAPIPADLLTREYPVAIAAHQRRPC
jgi:protein gp37